MKKSKKKIPVPKKIKNEIEKYPMVSIEWFDILSNSSWSSFDELKKQKLPTCITKVIYSLNQKVLQEFLGTSL